MARQAIFIGYRRDDTADVAGRIYDSLTRRFGRQSLFKDVDNLRPGADFGAYIANVLPKCRVFLALIGPGWLESRDETGARRIDDANDWVRIEIETALATKGLTVVPVLVNGARMPKSEEVPQSLRGLLRFHAATVRRDPDFHDDIRRMGEAIKESLKSGALDLTALGAGVMKTEQVSGGGRGFSGATVAMAVLAVAAGGWFVVKPMFANGTSTSEEPAPPANPVDAVVGSWRWDGGTCGAGAEVVRDGELIVVAIADTPAISHAVESVSGDTVNTIVVGPEALRGSQFAMTRRGDALEIKTLADGKTETWQSCSPTP